jgi:hypothetical protein
MQRKSRSYSTSKPSVIVEWRIPDGDRSALRRAVAEKWLEESPHTNYRYNVEQCASGRKVYLLRPTWLNKGFDFQVNVEGFRSVTRAAKGQTKEMPSHTDVIHDLQTKVKANPKLAGSLFDAVCDIYDCSEPTDVSARDSSTVSVSKGLPTDQLLYIIKWLFIEQDLTYWLQTGRDMLMAAIESEVFGISH